MSYWNNVRSVAEWEFKRFFKWRDQLISLVVSLLLAGLGFGLVRWLGGEQSDFRLALIEARPEWQAALPSNVKVVPTPSGADNSSESWRAALERKDIDGILTQSAGRPKLTVRKRTQDSEALVRALQQQHQEAQLAALSLSEQARRELFTPLKVEVESLVGNVTERRSKMIAGLALSALMMVGIWSGLAYLFVGITGEKQLRVTEQVVSAISAQAWIDGKILGLSGLGLVSSLNYALTAIVTAFGAQALGFAWKWPAFAASPGILLTMLALALLGLAFWNTFIAAVAATISDPHTSSRGALIMLPLLPFALSFMAIGEPDALGLRLLAVFPPTAPCVMTTRLAVGEPNLWEVLVAIALLLFAIHLLRRLAGRIFGLAMLNYGKEPGWAELRRWINQPNP